MQFRDEYSLRGTFGSFSNVNGGIKNYDFNDIKSGMIGVFGTFTSESLNSMGPYSNPGICTCDDTTLYTVSISDMAADVTSGVPTVETIPVFPDTFNC